MLKRHMGARHREGDNLLLKTERYLKTILTENFPGLGIEIQRRRHLGPDD